MVGGAAQKLFEPVREVDVVQKLKSKTKQKKTQKSSKKKVSDWLYSALTAMGSGWVGWMDGLLSFLLLLFRVMVIDLGVRGNVFVIFQAIIKIIYSHFSSLPRNVSPM